VVAPSAMANMRPRAVKLLAATNAGPPSAWTAWSSNSWALGSVREGGAGGFWLADCSLAKAGRGRQKAASEKQQAESSRQKAAGSRRTHSGRGAPSRGLFCLPANWPNMAFAAGPKAIADSVRLSPRIAIRRSAPDDSGTGLPLTPCDQQPTAHDPLPPANCFLPTRTGHFPR